MSYDVDFGYPACSACGRSEETVFSWDPTYNYRKIFLKAGIHPKEHLLGKTGEEAGAMFLRAVEAMQADREAFIALEPPNGWGTVAELIECLEERLIPFCKSNPRCLVKSAT